ncbi:MAG: hypothetical protein J6R04_07555, partial [Clostridia bacterium]|nr:hypothetical protein [Clostridia bacterium]
MCDNTPDARTPSVAFSQMTGTALSDVAAALGLRMRQGQLAACAAYYRSALREPTPTELCLLDACVNSFEHFHLPELTLQALDTDDSSLADALRAAVNALSDGRRSTPILTLQRVLGTPQAPLPRFDQHTGARLRWLTEAQYATLCRQGEHPTQSLRIGASGLRLCATETASTLPARHVTAGCIVSLLTLPDQSEATLALLRQWLAQKQTSRRTRRLLYVPRGTLLATLITQTSGVQLDLGSICPHSDRTHASQLTDIEGYLLISSQNETHALLESARELGFTARAFARTLGTGELSLAENDKVLLSLPMRFLHTFDRPRAVKLHCRTKDEQQAPQAVSVTTEHSMCDGWQRVTAYAPDEPVRFGEWTVLHTTIVLDSTLTHRHVTEQMLHAALRLVTAGADAETLFACAALSLHPDHSPRPAWSAALGLRALTEAWKMPLADAIVTASDGECDTLTVCLAAKTLTCAVKDDHSELRLMSTPRAEDGSLPLSTLATVLRTASCAMREGHASAPVAWIDRAVADVDTDGRLASVPDAAIPQTGLVLRTDATVTQGVRLGEIPVTAPADASSSTDEDTPCKGLTVPTPLHYSSVHVAHPTVLMPVPVGLDTPTALIEPLRRIGANVHVLPCRLTHKDCTDLADAIAACDVLLLNGDDEVLSAMLAHQRVAHAMAQKFPDHATLVLLHRATSLDPTDAYLPRES